MFAVSPLSLGSAAATNSPQQCLVTTEVHPSLCSVPAACHLWLGLTTLLMLGPRMKEQPPPSLPRSQAEGKEQWPTRAVAGSAPAHLPVAGTSPTARLHDTTDSEKRQSVWPRAGAHSSLMGRRSANWQRQCGGPRAVVRAWGVPPLPLTSAGLCHIPPVVAFLLPAKPAASSSVVPGPASASGFRREQGNNLPPCEEQEKPCFIVSPEKNW